MFGALRRTSFSELSSIFWVDSCASGTVFCPNGAAGCSDEDWMEISDSYVACTNSTGDSTGVCLTGPSNDQLWYSCRDATSSFFSRTFKLNVVWWDPLSVGDLVQLIDNEDSERACVSSIVDANTVLVNYTDGQTFNEEMPISSLTLVTESGCVATTTTETPVDETIPSVPADAGESFISSLGEMTLEFPRLRCKIPSDDVENQFS